MKKKLLSISYLPIKQFLKLSKVKKIVVIILILILLTLINQTVSKKESDYITEKAKKATITQTVAETGNLNSGAAVNLTSPTTGIVNEVFVFNGQIVEAGDLVLKITSTATEQKKAEAYSTYLAAQDALNTASAGAHTLRSSMYTYWDIYYDMATGDNYENGDGSPRSDERLDPEFQIAQENWIAAEKEYKDQQTTVAQAQAKVSSTWLLYQATQNAEVKAHSSGKIANLSVSEGMDIDLDENILAIVNDTNNTTVSVPINEIDISKIKAGQKAIIEIDAIDDEKFKGKVDRVDSVGTNSQGVVTYNVYIELSESNPNFRSGMTTNVEIETNTVRDVLTVPNSSVKPYQGGRAVQILENGKPKYIPVRIGVRGEARTQIIDGIIDGQEIIVGTKNAQLKKTGAFGF